MACKAVMVAATRQHVGKTSVSMALLSGLRKRFDEVAYMKPVGQKYVLVENGIKVDKDIRVGKEHFQLSCAYEHMSPVIIDSNYTRRFIDGEISVDKQVTAIRRAFDALTATNDFVVVEGTGHLGVGSCVGLSNAKVASLLGLDMIIVVNGGVGSALDELELNRALCKLHGVALRGVIMNRVQPSKIDMVHDYVGRALKASGIPLIAVVPDGKNFDQPSIMDLENLLETSVISSVAEADKLQKFTSYNFVTTSLRRFMEKIDSSPEMNTACFVTHASRSDIILGLLSHVRVTHGEFQGGLIITGTPPRNIPAPFVLNPVRQAPFPILNAHHNTTDVLRLIKDYTAKLRVEDPNHINTVIAQYEKYIDFDAVLNRGGDIVLQQAVS